MARDRDWLQCPECDHRLWYTAEQAGKRARCPKCNHRFPLPCCEEELESVLAVEEPIDAANDQPLAKLLTLIGQQAEARHPDDPEAASTDAAERIALALTGCVCQSCFRLAPTRRVEFAQHIGAVVVFFQQSISGDLCKACINKYFTEYTLMTLVLGWWGCFSSIVTPFALLYNVIRYLLTVGLAYGPDETRRDGVMPIITVMLALFPFVAVFVLILASIR